MHIETYSGKYDKEIVSLILDIQNNEAKINLSLEEQPDLLDINRYYQQNGGEFWIALSDNCVIGTVGLMLKEKNYAVLKKFFVKKEFRSQKVGLAYTASLSNLLEMRVSNILYWILLLSHMHHISFTRQPDF